MTMIRISDENKNQFNKMMSIYACKGKKIDFDTLVKFKYGITQDEFIKILMDSFVNRNKSLYTKGTLSIK